MAIAAPKVSLHLYLNNPYGLLSATIPNYDIYTPDGGITTPSPNGVNSPHKFPAPLPGIQENPEQSKHVQDEEVIAQVNNVNAPKLRFNLDYQEPNQENKNYQETKIYQDATNYHEAKTYLDAKSTHSSYKYGYSSKKTGQKQVPTDNEGSSILPRCKSTSGQSCETNISTESSPRLGFTWSINVDKEKRRRRLMPPRPTPDALLQRLGINRNIEPIGIVKLKRPKCPHARVTSYHIQKLPLKDKGQRKVSEKLAEWLDQYNEVSLKQQEYLQKIHTLRRSLQHTDDKRVAVTIEKMRGATTHRDELENSKHRRKYPVHTLTRIEDSVINNGPSHFPNRPQVVHTDEKPTKTNIKLGPNAVPRKLAPIVKKIRTPRGGATFETAAQSPISNNNNANYLSPRPEMTKMSTEYEPFESIARRNRLNFHQFLNPSIAIGQKSIGTRKPVQMSNVRIINEVAEAHSSDNRSSPSDSGPIYTQVKRTHVKGSSPR